MTDAPSKATADALRHSHDFLGAAHGRNARATLLVVWLTATTMAVEIVAGFLTGSMALLADGVHMATHAGALGLAAFAYAYARRHANDPAYSFGTGKVGDLAGFASALILGIAALGIAVESARRLIEPTAVAFDEAIVVAVVGLLVNLASAVLLGHGSDGRDGHHGHSHGGAHAHHHHDGHGHAHHAHAHHDHGHTHSQDNNLRAAYLHVLADALTSVLAIAALLAGRAFGWVWLDAAVGILGALVIARWAAILLRDTAGVLLDRADPALAGAIRAGVEGPGDARICDLHVWRVGPGAFAAIVGVVGRPGLDGEAVRARLVGVDGLAHVTVECRALA